MEILILWGHFLKTIEAAIKIFFLDFLGIKEQLLFSGAKEHPIIRVSSTFKHFLPVKRVIPCVTEITDAVRSSHLEQFSFQIYLQFFYDENCVFQIFSDLKILRR